MRLLAGFPELGFTVGVGAHQAGGRGNLWIKTPKPGEEDLLGDLPEVETVKQRSGGTWGWFSGFSLGRHLVSTFWLALAL